MTHEQRTIRAVERAILEDSRLDYDEWLTGPEWQRACKGADYTRVPAMHPVDIQCAAINARLRVAFI